MELANKTKLTDFEMNKENPFLKQAIEQVQQNVVKRFKMSGRTDQKAVLKAVDKDNNVVGHTSFIRQIEVDEDQFTKVYLSHFSSFFDLKPQAIKVFGYIMTQLIPNKDEFIFDREECMEYTGYKSDKSIFIGLTNLLQNSIIARGNKDYKYFINPMVAFNGDRITFARTYVKRKTKNNPPKNLGSFNFDDPDNPYTIPTIEIGEAF